MAFFAYKTKTRPDKGGYISKNKYYLLFCLFYDLVDDAVFNCLFC